MKRIKIAVVGAGAIGGVIAGFIAKAGYNVVAVCKHRDLAARIRSGGLVISGVKGYHKAVMPAVATTRDLTEKMDIIFLTTKAYDMLDAAEELKPLLKSSSAVVSVQNGMAAEDLVPVIGRERIVGCVVGFGAIMREPGVVEMSSGGEFIIGSLNGMAAEKLLEVKKILSAVTTVRISDNIRGNLYAKLIVNSAINSLGAITGLTLGRMLRIKKIRNIFLGVADEAMVVAKGMGLNVETGIRNLNYYKTLDAMGPPGRFMKDIFIRVLGVKYRNLKSSSLQSLERGRQTEIDFLNGYIAKNGRMYNVPTPLNDKIIKIVKEIESRKRRIGLRNLDDLFFAGF